MAQIHDYIPWQDAELLAFTKNPCVYSPGNYTRRQVPGPSRMPPL
jgi:hypothetical protein